MSSVETGISSWIEMGPEIERALGVKVRTDPDGGVVDASSKTKAIFIRETPGGVVKVDARNFKQERLRGSMDSPSEVTIGSDAIAIYDQGGNKLVVTREGVIHLSEEGC